MTTLWRGLAAVAVAATLIGGVTSCTDGGSGSSETAAPAADAGGGAVAREMAPGLVDRDTSATAGKKGHKTLLQARSVIRTGEVSVTRRDLDAARAELDTVLAALEGFVESESTEHDRRGRIARSTVVVRVPVDRFGDAMSELEALGRTRHSDVDSEDVTTEVIDVDERVETLENSLDRLQGYQRDARDIEDLLRYEQQITEREAELQSLRSQQAYLHDQTSMSTITVQLSRPARNVPPPSALDDAGFLAGLQSGWNALTDTVVVVLTVVGAVTPFAVVLALVAVPLWLLVRRTVRTRGDAAPAAADQRES